MTHLLILLWLPALLTPAEASEPGYCAFEVKVSNPSATPLAEVPVVLMRKDSTVVSETKTTKNGIAKLCDAPLEPVDIFVGFDMCGSVVVKNMKPSWPSIRRVFVTYVRTFCPHFVFEDRCVILLRVQDEEGRPVAGARLEGVSSTGPESDVSDVFGRIFQSIRFGEKLEGIVTKEGREQARVSEQCRQYDVHDVERRIVLHAR